MTEISMKNQTNLSKLGQKFDHKVYLTEIGDAVGVIDIIALGIFI